MRDQLAPRPALEHIFWPDKWENAIQLIRGEDSALSAAPEKTLPAWLNIPGVLSLKNLKIIRRHSRGYRSVLEHNAVFDHVRFEITHETDNGVSRGDITFWIYQEESGVRLFAQKQNAYHIKIDSFNPNLPRGLSETDAFGRQTKAGVGTTLLWLLLAREESWQNKKAVIVKAETPSQKVFSNLGHAWPADIFSAHLLFMEESHFEKNILPKVVNVSFMTPSLDASEHSLLRRLWAKLSRHGSVAPAFEGLGGGPMISSPIGFTEATPESRGGISLLNTSL